jgi:hypothetical protein
MDTVSFLVFEDPLTLWVILGLAEVVALVIWRRTRSRRAATVLVALPAAAVLLGLLALVVETDREAVLRSIGVMDRAVAAGDADAFLSRVSADYRTSDGGKDALAAAVRLGLARVRATPSAPVLAPERTPQGERRFRVTQDYRFEPAPGSQTPILPAWQRVTWEGEFQRDPDGEWRLVAATAVRPERFTAEEAAARYFGRRPRP